MSHRLAGQYDNPLPQSAISPRQGLRIWPHCICVWFDKDKSMRGLGWVVFVLVRYFTGWFTVFHRYLKCSPHTCTVTLLPPIFHPTLQLPLAATHCRGNFSMTTSLCPLFSSSAKVCPFWPAWYVINVPLQSSPVSVVINDFHPKTGTWEGGEKVLRGEHIPLFSVHNSTFSVEQGLKFHGKISSCYQCCGSGTRCLFDPWIRDRE